MVAPCRVILAADEFSGAIESASDSRRKRQPIFGATTATLVRKKFSHACRSTSKRHNTMDGTTISRGFRSRRQEQTPKNRLPPGQYVTTDFPVLSAGPTPQ